MSTGERRFYVLHIRRVLQEPLLTTDCQPGLACLGLLLKYVPTAFCFVGHPYSILSQHINFRNRRREDGLRSAAPGCLCLPGKTSSWQQLLFTWLPLVAVQDLFWCRLAHTCELKRVRRALSCATTTKERGSPLRKVLALTLRSSQPQRRQATGMHGLGAFCCKVPATGLPRLTSQ